MFLRPEYYDSATLLELSKKVPQSLPLRIGDLFTLHSLVGGNSGTAGGAGIMVSKLRTQMPKGQTV